MRKVKALSTDTRRGKKVPVKLSVSLDAKQEEAPSGLPSSWAPISGARVLSPVEGGMLKSYQEDI